MILDQIQNISRYTNLPGALGDALANLQSMDVNSLNLGRNDLAGKQYYALLQEYQTKPESAAVWEAHKKYIDIQYLLTGSERIGCTPIDLLTPLAIYDSVRDFSSSTGKGPLFLVPAGWFIVLFPGEAHLPGLHPADLPIPVKKLVMKVPVD
jgi:biofilm protein TabA